MEWLNEFDMIVSPASVLPVQYFESQPGSQLRPCLTTTPDRQVGQMPTNYHIDGDLLVRARALKDKSIATDFERSTLIVQMLERLVTGFEMLVRGKDLIVGYRRHVLS